jgi:hypothetical protein
MFNRISLFKLFTVVILINIVVGCTPKLEKFYLTDAMLIKEKSELEDPNIKNSALCNDALNYAPDLGHIEHTPMKTVRVNVHFMNSADSSKNLYGPPAIEYAKKLIYYANLPLAENDKMFLPEGNNTATLPLRYRYVLYKQPNIKGDHGVYSHFDDELYFFVRVGGNRNLGDKRALNTYNVGEDTVLNIFILPHQPDSVISPTYEANETGIAIGNAIKIAGLTESDKPIWNFKGLVNHEIGHVLGLAHTWRYNDGCDDTPKNANCWNITKSPACDSSKASNNVMDYNSRQSAWSPCQIGRIHRNFANEISRSRRILEPNWCTLNEAKNIVITDSIHWKGAKDLEGNIIVEKGGVLKISCRISLPKNAKITVKAGGILILNQCRLHNSCGDNWDGIEIEQLKKETGIVITKGNVKFENMTNIPTNLEPQEPIGSVN